MKHFSIQQQWVLFVIALLLLGILTLRFYVHSSHSPPEEILSEIVVEVSGEVQNPGVYLFQNPPTLREAIGKAGGLKEIAQFDLTSPAEALETGALITVLKESLQTPSLPPLPKGGDGEIKHGEIKHEEIKIRIGRMAAHKLLIFSIPLDLNQISAEDLCLVPKISESLAQEIVAYRQKRRGFQSVEELKNVKGIGEKRFQSLKNFFIVEK